MRILRAVDGSVLWLSSLLEDNPWAKSRLRSEAEKQGVAAERLIFAVRLPMAEHLARQREADLFLDTLPFNAHTTASDALWAGLPVLTQIGDAYPGRVAASLLKAVGLSELVVQTQAEYEALAVELASDHERLNQLKQTLAANRSTASLFNTPLLATQLEAAYTLMLDRYEADLPPDDIDVP
jgi:predicted O-linked N-acetylglucosamine transferase (SPINDLY family)